MSKKSLQQIMNEMAQRIDTLDDLCPHECVLQGAEGEDMVKLSYYIAKDEVMAALYKLYVEALARDEKLLRENGPDDPMAMLAHDMTESARSAMMTRLLELQQQEEEMFGAQALALRKHKTQYEMLLQKRRKEKREKEKEEHDTTLWLYLWFWITQQTAMAAQKQLSLRKDFLARANAALPDIHKKAANA